MPTWTCAPYQGGASVRFGQNVAWGESNAVFFANSVVGARTNRFGDLLDVCAAVVSRVPRFRLYLSENRRATAVFRVAGLPSRTSPAPTTGRWGPW